MTTTQGWRTILNERAIILEWRAYDSATMNTGLGRDDGGAQINTAVISRGIADDDGDCGVRDTGWQRDDADGHHAELRCELGRIP